LEVSVAIERTLSIIKPDAVKKQVIGKIVGRFEEEGLRICAMKKVHLSVLEAEGFYAVHKARPFFGELTEFMSSGPCVVMVLEGPNAIARNRDIMGATNPEQAEPGTLRKLFARDISQNAVHGSDGPESARTEIAYFFAGTELL
jgi:nucleoside-diphosphate kinase